MRFILLFILGVGFLNASAQIVKYSNQAYTSYFSPRYHEPLYVVYNLDKGGGPCNRDQWSFINGDCQGCATGGDYSGQGYDKGHLCNAEDEAGNCRMQQMTFRYYNCVPQTTRLNRGIWKTWETRIRAESQMQKLTIICGSIFGNRVIGNAAVPDYCWKVVYDAMGNLRYCLIFPNDDSGTVGTIGLAELKMKLGYPLTYSLN